MINSIPMFRRVCRYFKSYSMFVQLQLGIRRRVLESLYRLFHVQLVTKLDKRVCDQISNKEFLASITSLVNIPENLDDCEDLTLILKSADSTCDGNFDLLGSGEIQLKKTDWHLDFKSGFRWVPGKFHRDYNQEEINNYADVKVPRELSRSHHLLKVAIAYKLTNESKYAKFCVEQMSDWVYENPLMYSINWGCTMDVAIRAVNWIYTLALIADSKDLNDSFIATVKKSLYQHGWFIFRNPEKDEFNNGNHYLADLSGQIVLGLIFISLDECKVWVINGMKELFREIRMEILPSGMTYERSTNYNRLVLELIIVPILLLRSKGYEIPQDIWFRIEKMFELIMHILKPDGTIPIVGDQDNGRLLPFSAEETIDFRYLLSLGSLLYTRADLKHYGNGFNTYCSLLGGENAKMKWNSIPDAKSILCSHAFPDIGLYLMRKDDNYLLFNATGRGLYPELRPGAHTHSDLFSFELFTSGRSFLIDPGSYVYSGDAEQRMLFRSTKMHNTVTVDGESQDVILLESLWDFERNAIPKVLKWESTPQYDMVEAIHHGYNRLPEPVMHKRKIIFDKIEQKWIIEDTISGEGQHICELYLHFDAGLDFKMENKTVYTLCNDGNNIKIVFELDTGLSLRKESSFVSKSYGKKEHGYVLIASINRLVPIKFNSTITKFFTK